MAVYVDPLVKWGGSATFRWTHSCHMFADSLDELHAFALRIGLRRSWFQNDKLPHYDLNPSRRCAALRAGAIELDLKQSVDKWAEISPYWRRVKEALAARDKPDV